MRDELVNAKRRRCAGKLPFFGTSPPVTIDSWEQKLCAERRNEGARSIPGRRDCKDRREGVRRETE